MKPGEPEVRGMLREAGNMAWTSRPETGGPGSRERERGKGLHLQRCPEHQRWAGHLSGTDDTMPSEIGTLLALTGPPFCCET